MTMVPDDPNDDPNDTTLQDLENQPGDEDPDGDGDGDGKGAGEGDPSDEEVFAASLQKYKSPVALAKAHRSAEQKISEQGGKIAQLERELAAARAGKPPEPPKPGEGKPEEGGEGGDKGGKGKGGDAGKAVVDAAALNRYSAEWFANDGKLSDETYAELETRGISREAVDLFAKAQVDVRQAEDRLLLQTAGVTPEAWTEMQKWGQANLPSEEWQAWEALFYSSSPMHRRLAVQTLQGAYGESQGTRRRTEGMPSGASDLRPFASDDELVAAMSKKDTDGKRLYDTDPAYRQRVQKRINLTNRKLGS